MNLRHIRNYLSLRIGSKIKVIYNGARNRKEKYYGVIYKTYSNVFIIILASGEIKSFNYIDILTKTIQIYI